MSSSTVYLEQHTVLCSSGDSERCMEHHSASMFSQAIIAMALFSAPCNESDQPSFLSGAGDWHEVWAMGAFQDRNREGADSDDLPTPPHKHPIM